MNLTDTFDPKLCEEMTGYTFRDGCHVQDYEHGKRTRSKPEHWRISAWMGAGQKRYHASVWN